MTTASSSSEPAPGPDGTISSVSRRGLDRRVAEEPVEPGDEVGVVDQPIGDVHRGVEPVAVAVPLLEARERVLGDGERQRADERRALEMGDELRRADEPVAAQPPDERLDGRISPVCIRTIGW